MGVPVLILGASGSGKSASLRNFKKEDLGVINVAYKPLPFRNDLIVANTRKYGDIVATLKANTKNCYVIDDSQYLMAFDQINRVKENGFGKYTEMALDFTNVIQTVVLETNADTIVYFLHHIEQTEDGRIKAKTIGKLIDNWLTLEGLFSIVLMAEVTRDKKHIFATQSDGFTTCKSPMGMFKEEIDNDLKFVDTTIREYYGMKQLGGKRHD